MNGKIVSAILATLLLISVLTLAFNVQTCIGVLLGGISITASPTTVTLGESTTISGAITPPFPAETITIGYRKIGKPWGMLATVTTDETGHYIYLWTPSQTGTYELKATWISETYVAESSAITVDVVGVHDIAITNIVRSPTEVTVGDTVDIDVTVWNNGSYSENFDVIVKYDTTVIDTHSVTLASGDTATEPFTWDTTGVVEGTYTISAEVPAVTGETDTADNTRTDGSVKVSLPEEPPVASFTYSPSSPVVNETIIFDASASSDPDGTIDSYEWNFGDGTTDTVTVDHVDHAYVDDGNYTVKLEVTDNDGLKASITNTIEVSPLPSLTIDSLIDLVEEFCDLGDIDSENIRDSLLTKLHAAKAKIRKSQVKTAKNILGAFINHIQAQCGKHITPEAADILIESAEHIISHL